MVGLALNAELQAQFAVGGIGPLSAVKLAAIARANDTRHQPLRRVEMLAVSTDFCSFRQRQRDLLRPGGRQAKLFFAPLRNKSAKLTPVEVPYLLDSKKSAVPS